jgi:hypothetical protein
MRWSIAASLFALCSTPVLGLECPDGAYPWIGRHGVEYCKRDIIGPQAPVKSTEACPAGMRLVATPQGDRVCKRAKSRG